MSNINTKEKQEMATIVITTDMTPEGTKLTIDGKELKKLNDIYFNLSRKWKDGEYTDEKEITLTVTSEEKKDDGAKTSITKRWNSDSNDFEPVAIEDAEKIERQRRVYNLFFAS